MTQWLQKPPIGAQIDWSHPLSKGLAGCWLMNEGGGSRIYDLSGNGNTGTLTNGPLWAPGKDGADLKLDGVDDCIVFSKSLKNLKVDSRFFTVKFKAYFPSGVTSGNLLEEFDSIGGWRLYLRVGPGLEIARKMTVANSRISTIASYTFPLGMYHDVIMIGQPAGNYIVPSWYIDGVPIGWTTRDGGSGSFVSAAESFVAGSATVSIVNIMAWNRDLSAVEVADLYVNPYGFIRQPRQYWMMPRRGVPIHQLARRAA